MSRAQPSDDTEPGQRADQKQPLMHRLVSSALGWLVRAASPKHPAGSASGELTPLVDYVAIYVEGDPAPAVVVVMRFPIAAHCSMASVSGSLRAGADRTPNQVRITSGQRDVTCALNTRTRVLLLQGSQIPLGSGNLVLCDVTATNELTQSSVSVASAVYKRDLRGFDAQSELLRLPAVREFLALGGA